MRFGPRRRQSKLHLPEWHGSARHHPSLLPLPPIGKLKHLYKDTPVHEMTVARPRLSFEIKCQQSVFALRFTCWLQMPKVSEWILSAWFLDCEFQFVKISTILKVFSRRPSQGGEEMTRERSINIVRNHFSE